jgi:glycosyltransferase involved in cell wall biosynthesis
MAASGKVFVVIPAYTEAQNLSSLLPHIADVLCKAGRDFQIVVVNDGSRDNTRGVAEDLAGLMAVRVISHPTNLGVGKVFLTGLHAATESARADDIIALMEADSTNDPELLPEMIRRIDAGDDVVIGSRYEKGGRYHKFPPKRLMLSLAANAGVRALFPIRGAKDYTIFYRAYRAAVLQRGFAVFSDNLIETRTFVCNAELLIKLNHVWPLRVSEVPLVYRYDLKKGKSKMPIKKTIREYVSFVRQARRTLRQTLAPESHGAPVASAPKPS